jgi:hypothetical protein
MLSPPTSDSRMIPLDRDKIFVLANPYQLDGPTHTFPAWATGFAPSNSYLLLEDDEALLVDTGLSVHEDALLAQVGELLGDRRLAIYSTRFGEFNTICNVRALVENFDVAALYAAWPNASQWMDIRPKYTPPGTRIGHGRLARLRNITTSSGGSITIGAAGAGRRIKTVMGALRLLPAHWLWDESTGTLLTSDAFTHVWRESSEGPWIVTPDCDAMSADEVLDYLTATRFWWLSGANTAPLIEHLQQAFHEFPDLRAIGPGYGCALVGTGVAKRHLNLLEDALRLATTLTSNGVYLGQTYQDATPQSGASAGA